LPGRPRASTHSFAALFNQAWVRFELGEPAMHCLRFAALVWEREVRGRICRTRFFVMQLTMCVEPCFLKFSIAPVCSLLFVVLSCLNALSFWRQCVAIYLLARPSLLTEVPSAGLQSSLSPPEVPDGKS
jgi:hypothetical protein